MTDMCKGIKKSENEEAIPSYRQLNEWLAAMTANEHVKDRDDCVIGHVHAGCGDATQSPACL